MGLFPKKHFKWREPKAYLKLADEFGRASRRWWHQPLAVVIAAALLLSAWASAHLNPEKHPPPFSAALPAALVAGLFFAYVLPWIVSFCPSEVSLFDDAFFRMRGNMHLRIKYAESASFAWGVREDFATLILKRHEPKPDILVGVPNDLSRKAVSEFLLERQVAFDPGSVAPPGE